MDAGCQNSDLDPKYLLGQLNTARKEINNLRQQIKSLRYVHEKDVDNIKRLLGLSTDGITFRASNSILTRGSQPSTSTDTDDTLKLKPIGLISTWFPSKRGTPRQPGICGKAPGKLTLFNSVFTNPEHALEGLQDFSHMWILFHFHRNDSTHVRAKVAPPRLNGARTGVFSTRSPHRPCPIGLSLVKIVKIENNTIFFEGVDMVDQTPVLDIKPYIPQYDNPLHIEKSNGRQVEYNLNDSEILENIDQRLTEEVGISVNANIDFDFNEGSNRTASQEPNSPISISNATQASDISRDEEIALRLQAEEFEGIPNYEDFTESRNYFRMPDNFENASGFESNAIAVSRNPDIIRDRTDVLNTDFNASNRREATTVESTNTVITRNTDFQSEIRETGQRLQSINLNSHDTRNASRTIRSNDVNYTQDQRSRNSRLLDGADGSSTVYGTDLDLIRRRTINPRLDNSPVRMGIREAPDGEEGFASQTLTSSQTVSNIQGITSTSNSNVVDSITVNLNTEVRAVQNTRAEINSAEVRVPDWIFRPRVSTLSVVFNDRALIQLNEILEDKTDEQKRAIENVLREDPRSVYLRQRWGNQFYTFLIHDLHISCRFDDNRGVVTVFQVRHAGRTCECGEPEWQCLGHSPLS
ncbi:uncharacterized protein LOC107262939 [Cephus cinctus]|uniref:Uncharacterized protein LOC107262939 n=1 Tax=Cephus cinctus TaxID=211228 RepID=A0AAJ7BG44_CEPCN|nr:uncharacterized protein LOC107262939 [Cephus cinctus]XP_024936110.1 uncharacterized protein LOC107262939 [Cephus cinctus]